MSFFGNDDKDVIKAIREVGRSIDERLEVISLAISSIANALTQKATRLILLYNLKGGNKMGAPVSGSVGQVFNPTVVESNPTTPSIPPIGPLVFASDNAAVVTVDAAGNASCVAAGSANVSCMDQGNGLTDTVAFAVSGVTPPPATSLTLSYNLQPAARIR